LTAPKLTAKQKEFLKFLRSTNGTVVQLPALLKSSGLSDRSWRVYWTSGRYAPYLTRNADGTFTVHMKAVVDDDAFYRQVTQKVSGRVQTSAIRNPLVPPLLEKSRENMILALELYNRPSLKNRLDGFCMLFCTAWDQLLKAEMLTVDGEGALYTGSNVNGRQETYSLRRCIERRMPEPADPVRKNLLEIVNLRDAATHLLMPEILSTYSQLFQAGVKNFAQRYEACCNEKFLPPTSTGLLVLVHEGPTPTATTMAQLYGETTAQELFAMCQAIDASVRTEPDARYAVPMEHKLVFAKKPGDADITLLSGPGAPLNGIVVIKEKLISMDQKYPHLFKDVVHAVEQKLSASKQSGALQLVLSKEGWRESENEYHHQQPKPAVHKYSEKAVVRAVELISTKGYLDTAKKWQSDKRKTKRKS
jgi:hypothetical protein